MVGTKIKISFLGDSITEGASATKKELSYPYIVKELLNCEIYVDGISGSRIAKQTLKSANQRFDLDFIDRSLKLPIDSDLVIVFGGTNDYGHGDAPLGDLDSLSLYTFTGACKKLSENLLSRFDKNKILFILPLHRDNEDSIYGDGIKYFGHDLGTYIERLVYILEKYEIKYLDFYTTPIFPIPTSKEKNDYYQDGLHPTNLGHKILGEQIAKHIKRTLRIWY